MGELFYPKRQAFPIVFDFILIPWWVNGGFSELYAWNRQVDDPK
jgi:hypothetical protein